MKILRRPVWFFLFALVGLVSARAEPDWLTDFSKAQAQAKTEHKLLLLDFTGSDWCGWCKRLEAEVFSKPAFAEYAKENLVLVRADFPRNKPLTLEVRKQNQELAERFAVNGFPTIVVLNGDGKAVGLLGYMEGGPGPFIDELKKLPKS